MPQNETTPPSEQADVPICPVCGAATYSVRHVNDCPAGKSLEATQEQINITQTAINQVTDKALATLAEAIDCLIVGDWQKADEVMTPYRARETYRGSLRHIVESAEKRRKGGQSA